MEGCSADTDGDPAHITPQAYRAYLAQVRGVDPEVIHVPALVVGAFQHAVWQQLRERTAAVPDQAELPGEAVERGAVGDRALAVGKFPIGAPAATVLMEELIVCGAHRFLFISAAGSLQSTLPIGSLALATSAIREEGTSFHYLPQEVVPQATPSLTDALHVAAQARGRAVPTGPVWTTDAPYRELSSKVTRYAAQGVLAVEMEAAALFAVAAYRQAEAAMLLVIGDELFHPWKPGFHMAEFDAGLSEAVAIALAAAAAL
jgi:uridine phosphorylase